MPSPPINGSNTYCKTLQNRVYEYRLSMAGEILYTHLFRLAPVTKKLFPLEVRRRYMDWASTVVEAGPKPRVVELGRWRSTSTTPRPCGTSSRRWWRLLAVPWRACTTSLAWSLCLGWHGLHEPSEELNALGMRHINYNMQEEPTKCH